MYVYRAVQQLGKGLTTSLRCPLQRTWNYDAERDFPPIQEAWQAALQSGETFFDTAEIYGWGESEKIIGRLLKETSEEDARKVVLATKCRCPRMRRNCGDLADPAPLADFPLPTTTNMSFLFRPGCVQALRNSLERMGVDQVELYQVGRAFFSEGVSTHP